MNYREWKIKRLESKIEILEELTKPGISAEYRTTLVKELDQLEAELDLISEAGRYEARTICTKP